MKIARKILPGLFVILAATQLNAQIPNSMYFMPNVPQSNRINPAIQPGCSFYIGMPLLSPLRLQFSSGSLAFEDLIYYDPDLDMRITPFHAEGDKEAFREKLDPVNYILSDFGVSLASLGIQSGKSFFSFDVTTRMDGNIYYPAGIFDIAIDGFEEGGTTILNGLGADMTLFTEMALGLSRRDFLIPNLDIGVRGKLLFGLANISTKQSVIELETSMDEWNLHSEMELAMSTVPLLLDFNDYVIDFSDPQAPEFGFNTIDFTDISAVLDEVFVGQIGVGLDLGVNYKPIPQLKVSASVLDLGYINWKNTTQANFDFDYTFSGVEVNPFAEMDSTLADAFVDSISNAFVLTQGDPYTSRLNTKLFVGASYYPIEKVGVGLLSRTDFLNGTIAQQFTGTLNVTTGRHINLSMSYSYMQKQFNNMGAGISFVIRPFNLYLISDNIISAGLRPLEARSVNLWFGMNITFGWKRAAKKAKDFDQPLLR